MRSPPKWKPVPEEHVEEWVRDGCEMARRLLDAGLQDQAADLLRHIEIRALGKRACVNRHRQMRAKGCSVKGCSSLRFRPYRPWCKQHAPLFEEVA